MSTACTSIDVTMDMFCSYEWSILFLLILIAAVFAMCFHVWTLWKRRSSLSAYDILFVAFFFAACVQFGPMMSQVRTK